MAKMTKSLILAIIFSGVLFAPSVQAQEHKDREFQECTDCPVMVAIPAGRFVMGSPAGEPGRFDSEGPQHAVSVRAFALGKYDVTSEQFRNFLEATGYQPKPCNSILNLGWHSPGGGLGLPARRSGAAPMARGVSGLARRRCLYRLAQCPGEGGASIAAGRAAPIVCRAKRNGNMPRARAPPPRAGGAMKSATVTPIAMAAAAIGTTVILPMWTASSPIHSDFTACSAMPGNGRRIAGTRSYVGAPADGRAWIEKNCDKHVLRGGSWDNVPIFIRSAARSGSPADGGEYDYSSLAGFRVARDLP